jgi:MFS family permease
VTYLPSRSTDYLAASLLAAILFCVYNLNFRHGTGVDSISTTVLPVSIIREGNLDLDEFRALLSTHTRALDLSLNEFGGIQEQHGHLVTSYPLGAAIMAVPFFWIADRMHYLREWHHYRVVGKIAASFMVALSASFVFLALRLTLPATVCWLIALFFGLGTSAWPVSSQELWQHGPGTLCLAASAYVLARFSGSPSQRFAFMAGLFLALAVLCRLLNVVPVIALSCFILFHHRNYAVAFFAPLVACALAIAYYNIATYGQLSGGYDAIYQSQWHAWRGLNSHNAYSNPLLQGLTDVLLSPGRGLFLYSPFLIPAYVASIYFLIRPPQPLLRYLALWVILMSLALAKNTLWWGGANFGPRYFSETCVALAMLTGACWPLLTRCRFCYPAFIASGLFSISINGIGAVFAPYGCTDPTAVDRHPDWLRSWRHPEILRCVKLAVTLGPQPPEMLLYRSGDTDY